MVGIMASTFIHFRMGTLRVLDQIVICDLTDVGRRSLEPMVMPMPQGDYRIHLQYTGNRVGIRVVGISLTRHDRPPHKFNTLKHVLDIRSNSGYLMIADYVSALGLSESFQRDAMREIDRSYIRSALMMKEYTGALANDDIARMVVCQTGNGPGQYPILMRKVYRRERNNYAYRISFLQYLDENGEIIHIPSNLSAKRARF